MPGSNTPDRLDRVDIRGPRFAAWVTTAVLQFALIVSALSPPTAAIVLGLQAAAFAIGALFGPRRQPYGWLFATFVTPRLGPVREREPVSPLKFAQLVGFVFAACGGVAFATGAAVAGVIATAAALVAAVLNAAFGICLACQLYPFVARLRHSPRPA